MGTEEDVDLSDVDTQVLVDELASRCDDMVVLMQRNVADTGTKPHTCDTYWAGNPFTHGGMLLWAQSRFLAAVSTKE